MNMPKGLYNRHTRVDRVVLESLNKCYIKDMAMIIGQIAFFKIMTNHQLYRLLFCIFINRKENLSKKEKFPFNKIFSNRKYTIKRGI